MEYAEVIQYLEKQKKIHNVDALGKALSRLGLEINPAKAIVVSGTNGKGSTCATLQTLLHAAGKNVGFFSSPHLIKINERIKFNCCDISDEEFCNIFSHIRKKMKSHNFSYFEYLTLIAAYYFFCIHADEIDYAIFEVGMGGTLDATNAIPHNISVITKLGFDHEKKLGHSLSEIAKNKFGIISKNNAVFHTKFNEEILQLSRQYTQKLKCKFLEAISHELDVDTSGKYPIFKIKTQFGSFVMNLPGQRAAENASLAITIFDSLLDNTQRFLAILTEIRWPGRMEMINYKNRDIFLSGDHNVQGAESLLEILNYYNFRQVHFVVGICSDKNHFEMLKILTNVKNSSLYLTETPVKTLSISDYDKQFLELAKHITANPLEALDNALLNSCEEDLVVVTGSLYLVGAIKQHLEIATAK